MRFAHLADVHIGAWRDPSMKGLSLRAFREAVSIIIKEKLDFAIIAGDLFNTALPAIDHLQESVVLLKKLKQAGIPVYVVPGSHDYNAAGKSILDVLDEAELLINVMKLSSHNDKMILSFTKDQKTSTLLTGFGGRRGSLEHNDFKNLFVAEVKEKAFRIFVFHSSVEELKPVEMEAMASIGAEELPKGFDYYAGGHVHIVAHKDLPGRKNVVYPGPIFPANFSELWKLEKGGFYIYDNGKLEFVPLQIKKVVRLEGDAEGKSPEQLNQTMEARIKEADVKDSIVMMRLHGKLGSGKPGDIDFRGFFGKLYSRGAFFVMRNTSQLSSVEMERVQISSGTSEEVEEEMINKHVQSSKNQMFGKEEAAVIKKLIRAMSAEQLDGEKKYEYEARMKKEAEKILLK